MSANWANQTIWTGDGLNILRGMNFEAAFFVARARGAAARRGPRRSVELRRPNTGGGSVAGSVGRVEIVVGANFDAGWRVG